MRGTSVVALKTTIHGGTDMYRNAKFLLLLAALCWLPVTAQSQDADPFKVCARCHGQDGNGSKAPTPYISSLAPDYISASLKAYQDGSRSCGFSKIKCKMASRWSEDEIAAAAQHFSGLPRERAPQEFDAALAEQGKAIHDASCSECHSGTGSRGSGGLLFGQWRAYLEYAMEQYQAGDRAMPDGMKAAVESLDEAQWDALLNYYASVP